MEIPPTNIIIAFLKSYLLMFDVQMVSFAENKNKKNGLGCSARCHSFLPLVEVFRNGFNALDPPCATAFKSSVCIQLFIKAIKNVHCFVNAKCASDVIFDDTHNSAGIFQACSCLPASFRINTSASSILNPKTCLILDLLGTCRRCLQTVNDALTNHSVLKKC